MAEYTNPSVYLKPETSWQAAVLMDKYDVSFSKLIRRLIDEKYRRVTTKGVDKP